MSQNVNGAAAELQAAWANGQAAANATATAKGTAPRVLTVPGRGWIGAAEQIGQDSKTVLDTLGPTLATVYATVVANALLQVSKGWAPIAWNRDVASQLEAGNVAKGGDTYAGLIRQIAALPSAPLVELRSGGGQGKKASVTWLVTALSDRAAGTGHGPAKVVTGAPTATTAIMALMGTTAPAAAPVADLTPTARGLSAPAPGEIVTGGNIGDAAMIDRVLSNPTILAKLDAMREAAAERAEAARQEAIRQAAESAALAKAAEATATEAALARIMASPDLMARLLDRMTAPAAAPAPKAKAKGKTIRKTTPTV